LHVFRQAEPPQRVDCLPPKWENHQVSFPRIQQRTTASGVEPRFGNLSITSLVPLPAMSYAAATAATLLWSLLRSALVR